MRGLYCRLRSHQTAPSKLFSSHWEGQAPADWICYRVFSGLSSVCPRHPPSTLPLPFVLLWGCLHRDSWSPTNPTGLDHSCAPHTSAQVSGAITRCPCHNLEALPGTPDLRIYGRGRKLTLSDLFCAYPTYDKRNLCGSLILSARGRLGVRDTSVILPPLSGRGPTDQRHGALRMKTRKY